MITCPRCGRTSYNPNDERERYCGHCHLFHDDITLGERLGLYTLDGEQITPRRCHDFMEWAKWMDEVREPIAETAYAAGDIRVKVSTIFIGLDPVGTPPRLWETMTFSGDSRFARQQWRYTTRDEAADGHIKVCELVQERIEAITASGPSTADSAQSEQPRSRPRRRRP